MKRNIVWSVSVAVIAVGLIVGQAWSQDLNTQLTNFIIDMRAGTLGVNQAVTSIALGAGTQAAPSMTYALETGLGFRRSAAGTMVLSGSGADFALLDSGGFTTRSNANYRFSSTTEATGAADIQIARGGAGLLNLTDADGTPDLNINFSGSPTLSACGTGTLATGSSNSSGRVDIVGATACTLTFSVSFGGNSADCVIANLIANRGFVSAASATAFTISSVTDGDDVMYICLGR